MAGAGYKQFADGDVLTAAQVQTYLQDQAVMKFADSSARTTGLGTAVAEGMLSYLADSDAVEVYDGSAWTALGGGGFTASTAITATDASWSVPTLADPVVRVTVIAGGGGGGGSLEGTGSTGGSSTFSSSAGTATSSGGSGGRQGGSTGNGSAAGDNIWRANNGGGGATNDPSNSTGLNGFGGQVSVSYFDLTGITTANVSIGAGGAGGVGITGQDGGDGGNGLVIFEYRAG